MIMLCTRAFSLSLSLSPICLVDDCIKGQNPRIYVAMQGASEFTLGGELEHWSITERNAALRIPALVLMGEFDTMSTECHQTVWVLAWALNSNPQLPFVALTFDSTGFACRDREYSKDGLETLMNLPKWWRGRGRRRRRRRWRCSTCCADQLRNNHGVAFPRVDSIPMAWPLVTIPRAAHCKLLDEPQLCVEAIARFLLTVEEIEAPRK